MGWCHVLGGWDKGSSTTPLCKCAKEGGLVLSFISSHCPASLGCFSSDFGHWISKGLEGGKTGFELHQLRQNLPLAYPVAKIGTFFWVQKKLNLNK